MMRRLVRVLTLLVLVVALAVGVVLLNPLQWLPADDVDAGPPLRDTATAATQELTRTFEAEGELRFIDQRAVVDSQQGVVGWISETERRVTAGDTLYERDEQPVVLFEGAVPAWRTLAVDAVGEDVSQLEANLAALGYGDESDFTIDDTYTSATAAVVERWQADLGVAETGRVALGDVVFGPADARVGAVDGTVGQSTAGSELLIVTGREREVRFSIGGDAHGHLAVGDTVEARLPDRSLVEVRVATITPAGSGTWQVVGSVVDSGANLPEGDSVPVTIDWSEVAAGEATTVPASALLRLDGGGYVVEVVVRPGVTELVPVEVGERFGTVVEILAGIDPGTTVIAP